MVSNIDPTFPKDGQTVSKAVERAFKQTVKAEIEDLQNQGPGGGGETVDVYKDGVLVLQDAERVNIVGAGATAAVDGQEPTQVNVNISGVAPSGGSGLYDSWEKIVPGLSAAEFESQLTAKVITARAAGTGVLLLGGEHDASQCSNISMPNGVRAVPIKGEDMIATQVTLPGTNKTFNDALFSATGDFFISDITFKNGAMAVSVPSSLSNKINSGRMERVTGVNCGAVYRYSTQTASVGSAFGRLQFRDIECYNVASGLHHLCGNPDGGGHVAYVDELILDNIKVVGFSHYGCAFFATNSPTNGVYPAGYDGYCWAKNIHVEDGLGTDASLQVGYAIVLHACKRVKLEDFFIKNIQPGVLIRMMGLYNKSTYFTARNGQIIDAGSDGGAGGGAISLKGSDFNHVAQSVLVENVVVELDQLQFNHAIWIQCANAKVKNCVIRGDWIFAPIGCQQSTEHPNVELIENKIYMTGATAGGNDEAAVQLSGFFDRARIIDNKVYNEVGNAHGVRLRTGAASNRSCNQGVIEGNVLHNISGGTGDGIKIDKRNGASMSDIVVQDNKVYNYADVIVFSAAVTDGTARIIDNMAVGETNDVVANGSTVNEEGNSWQ